MRTLTLGAGCFWCLEAVYRQTRGIETVDVGYTGGDPKLAHYAAVCSGRSGHAEALRVTYDDTVVPTEVVLGQFFTGHDPTSLNRQGNDVGPQYRSAMFYASEDERAEFAAAIAQWQEIYDRPIVTTLEPLGEFFPAEDVHQDFYRRNRRNGYCRVIIDPKVAHARRQWAEWMM